MTLVTTVPVAHEASDGRIVVQAPAATDRLEVSVSGRPTPARLVSTRAEDGRLRITVQISAVARTGADLEVVGYRRSRVVGRAVVDDVHLLGAGAFAQPRRGASIASARAEKEARSIAA